MFEILCVKIIYLTLRSTVRFGIKPKVSNKTEPCELNKVEEYLMDYD